MIKLIVFDLDDTLYPEKEYVYSGLNYLSNYLSCIYNNYNFKKVLLDRFNNGYYKNIFNYALDCYKIKYDNKLILKLIQEYRNHNPNIKLSYNVKKVLDNLKKNEKKLCLISDGFINSQKLKVKALSCDKIFDKIYFTDQYGKKNWKPSTYVFKMCQDYFNLSCKEIIFVGDNWEKDFFPGNKLGWITIGIDADYKIHKNMNVSDEYKPQIVIKSITELLPYIN